MKSAAITITPRCGTSTGPRTSARSFAIGLVSGERDVFERIGSRARRSEHRAEALAPADERAATDDGNVRCEEAAKRSEGIRLQHGIGVGNDDPVHVIQRGPLLQTCD